MIRVVEIEVWGFDHAIRGMRNPLGSHAKSDSGYGWDGEDEDMFVVGESDLDLMRRLYKAGTEHRKYLRQIFVSMDITAPLYWWKEMDTYKVLQNQITCIINSSGKVDHYGKYEEFYKSNVAPVKHIIEFAETGVKKEIHQMSTKGVAMGYIEGKDSVLFTEDDVDFGQEFTNLYTSTKHRAENLLLDTRESGIDVSLYRIGDIVFDRANGRFQENMEKNAIYLMVRAMFQFDCIPDGQIDFLEFTAVDFVSKAIVALVMTKSLRNETYHLLNSNRIGFKEWKEVFEVCDKKKNEVSVKEYLQYLKENYEQPKLQHYIQDFLTHTHVLEAHNYTNFIMLQERTDKILEKLHMKWTKPTKEQLIMMMQYGLAQNFFEPKDEFR